MVDFKIKTKEGNKGKEAAREKNVCDKTFCSWLQCWPEPRA